MPSTVSHIAPKKRYNANELTFSNNTEFSSHSH